MMGSRLRNIGGITRDDGAEKELPGPYGPDDPTMPPDITQGGPPVLDHPGSGEPTSGPEAAGSQGPRERQPNAGPSPEAYLGPMGHAQSTPMRPNFPVPVSARAANPFRAPNPTDMTSGAFGGYGGLTGGGIGLPGQPGGPQSSTLLELLAKLINGGQ